MSPHVTLACVTLMSSLFNPRFTLVSPSCHPRFTLVPSSFHPRFTLVSPSFHPRLTLVPPSFHPRFTLVSSSFHPRFTTIVSTPGIGPLAAAVLAEDDAVVGVGVDGPSLDTGNNKRLDSHRILFTQNKFGLEFLANMSAVPEWGAT